MAYGWRKRDVAIGDIVEKDRGCTVRETRTEMETERGGGSNEMSSHSPRKEEKKERKNERKKKENHQGPHSTIASHREILF